MRGDYRPDDGLGNVDERRAALDLMQSQPRRHFILEPTALVELHLLKALDAAKATLGRLGVVQATLEELRGLIAELDLHPPLWASWDRSH
jgi:hypothetical protein